MADEPLSKPSSPTITPGLNRPTPLAPLPGVPLVPTATLPPRPIAPPQGLSVKDANLSNLTPSPAPFTPTTPTPQPPAPPQASPGFKSTIRTMEEDLKRPQAPVSNIPKTPPPPPPPNIPLVPGTPPPPISVVAPPRSTPLPTPISRFSVPSGPTPTPLPVRPQFSIPAPSSASLRPPLSPSSVSIPPASGGSGSKKGLLIFALLLILIGGGLVWYFVIRKSGTATPTETPTASQESTPTPTSTPVLLDFNALFHPESAISYTTTTAPKLTLSEIDTSISVNKPGTGILRTFIVTDGQSARETLSQVVSDLKLHVPQSVVDSIDPAEFYITLFGLPDGRVSRGIMVKVKDPSALPIAMTAWEPTMSADLATLYKFDTRKAFSKTFLPNNFQGIPIRYRNFPDAFLTIDYAIIPIPAGGSYLIIVNSRDHIFSIIDLALGIVPGK